MTNLSDILPPSNVVTDTSTDTLTNKTLTSPKVNEDVAVTSTATELNILDGVTSTTAELNILDGVTSTAAELNILDGVTSTAAELNILDGVTSTAAELNALDGITAVVGELNALDIGSTAVGTAVASKAVILDSNKDYTGVRNLTISGELDAATLDISGDVDVDGTLETDALSINGTTVTSTAAELNILDGVTSTAAELNILDGVTSTTAELNLLDGVSATTAEINYLDGVTSSIQTQLGNVGGGSWELVTTVTASNSATVNVEGMNSTYVMYFIKAYDVVFATGHYEFGSRVKTGGSYNSGSNYRYHTVYVNSNGNGVNGESSGSGKNTSFTLHRAPYSADSSEPMFFEMTIPNPSNTATEQTVYYSGVSNNDSNTNVIHRAECGGVFCSPGAVTGIQFYSQDGNNITSGLFKLYGLVG